MTRLEQGDLTLAEAIAEAQTLGFAEAEPDADLDGHDAAAKLSILAYRAFGAWVRPDGFLVRGIRDIGPADCDLAESMGCRIRQIARAVRINGALDMAVEPLLLPTWHLLASVEEEYNAVYLRCASSGDLSLFGKGAGALPTATAVLGDLIDLAQDNSVRWPVPRACRSPGRHRRGAGAAAALPAHHRPAASGPRARSSRAWCAGTASTVQNRATRAEADRAHLAFMISASSDTQIADVRDAVGRLARVDQRLCLGGRSEMSERRVAVARPAVCPAERPPLCGDERRDAAAATTASTRTRGAPASPILHPDEPTVQLDLLRARRRSSRGRRARPPSCSPAKAAGRSCRTSTRATAPPPPAR